MERSNKKQNVSSSQNTVESAILKPLKGKLSIFTPTMKNIKGNLTRDFGSKKQNWKQAPNLNLVNFSTIKIEGKSDNENWREIGSDQGDKRSLKSSIQTSKPNHTRQTTSPEEVLSLRQPLYHTETEEQSKPQERKI